MRSTILFLTLLVFISCSIDSTSHETDPVLLELSNDPRSEAIFATMSIQLREPGQAGFDRILALLNELVEDARKQMQENRKLWAGTKARCEVTTQRLNEQEDYHKARILGLGHTLENVQKDASSAKGQVEFLTASQKTIADFLQNELNVIKQTRELYEGKQQGARNGVELADKAIEKIKSWEPNQPAGASFIQEAIEKVADAYLQVKSHKIFIPNSFVELAADDNQFKQRVLEWVGILRVGFLESEDSWKNVIKHREEHIWGPIQKELADLLKDYENDTKFFDGISTKGAETQKKCIKST